MTTTRRARPLAGLAALLALVALGSTAGPALADCQPAPSLEEAVKSAEVVFVGTVTALQGKATWATVTVTEIWRGPDLPATVTVRGMAGPAEFAEDDRALEVGVTYLFVPMIVDGEYMESICTATVPWARAAEALRPSDWRSPTGAAGGTDASSLDWLVGPVVAALVIGLVALLVAVVAGRRQER